MSNRTDFEALADELADEWDLSAEQQERIETELHNAYVAGEEGHGCECRWCLKAAPPSPAATRHLPADDHVCAECLNNAPTASDAAKDGWQQAEHYAAVVGQRERQLTVLRTGILDILSRGWEEVACVRLNALLDASDAAGRESVISSNRPVVEAAMMRVVSILVSDWEHEPYPGTFRHSVPCPLCDLWNAMAARDAAQKGK